VNGNCLDVSVLEWCKLFGEKRGEHSWGTIVKDPIAFEAGMLLHLNLERADFNLQVRKMREYRDKFVAHLDSDDTMHIPSLDVPKAAVWFYHAHLVACESSAADLFRFADLDDYYSRCEDEARDVYSGFGLMG
jgi:hypothetical protein